MSADLVQLLGPLGPLERHLWEALQGGRIEFQRCQRCGHAWLPPRAECPACLAGEWRWEEPGGRGELASWVVYHRAFHPALRDLVPYAVAVVALAEGPQMVAALEWPPGAAEPRCGAAIRLGTIERGGVTLACARPA